MLIEWNIWVYSRLLGLCPREFRCRFGDEMLGVFEDVLRDEAAGCGQFRLIVLSCSAYCELVAVAVRMNLRDAPLAAAGGSFVISSALFLALFRAVS